MGLPRKALLSHLPQPISGLLAHFWITVAHSVVLHNFRMAKNNRSKSVWTLFRRKLLNNQTVWPVIFGLTGPICARALKSFHLFELRPRGHHDWPVKPTIRPEFGDLLHRRHIRKYMFAF